MISLLGLLTGLAGPITTLANRIVELKTLKAKEENLTKKALIEQEIQENQDKRAVLIAEAGSRLSSGLNASIRGLIALGPSAYVLKYYLWDKVVGSFYGCTGSLAASRPYCVTFRTDPLSIEMAAILTAVIGFYFLTSMVKHK